MSRERVLVAVKMTFRGDDLTTPAAPDTSQAPQHGFPGSHRLYLCRALCRIGGLDYGPTDGGWAFAHQFAQAPDHRRAVFTSVAAEMPSNLVAVTAISAAVFFVGDRMGRIESETRNLEASPDSLAARIGRFGGADLTCFCGPAALRQSGGVPRLPIVAPILSRSASR